MFDKGSPLLHVIPQHLTVYHHSIQHLRVTQKPDTPHHITVGKVSPNSLARICRELKAFWFLSSKQKKQTAGSIVLAERLERPAQKMARKVRGLGS